MITSNKKCKVCDNTFDWNTDNGSHLEVFGICKDCKTVNIMNKKVLLNNHLDAIESIIKNLRLKWGK